jgi:hypothetical protein
MMPAVDPAQAIDVVGQTLDAAADLVESRQHAVGGFILNAV